MARRKPVPVASIGAAVDYALQATVREAVDLWYENRNDRLYPNDLEHIRIQIDAVSPANRTDIVVDVLLSDLHRQSMWKYKGLEWRDNLVLEPPLF